MTEEESNVEIQGTTERCAWVTSDLCSKGFDVFGLIREGLAIDKTQISAT